MAHADSILAILEREEQRKAAEAVEAKKRHDAEVNVTRPLYSVYDRADEEIVRCRSNLLRSSEVLEFVNRSAEARRSRRPT